VEWIPVVLFLVAIFVFGRSALQQADDVVKEEDFSSDNSDNSERKAAD